MADTTAIVDTAMADTAATGATGADIADAPPIVVELYAAGEAPEESSAPLRTQRAGADGRFFFEQLPEAPYRFRAFLDRDGDGVWDAGRLAPYRPAEPLTWSRQSVEARPRWETATEDTLRISSLPF